MAQKSAYRYLWDISAGWSEQAKDIPLLRRCLIPPFRKIHPNFGARNALNCELAHLIGSE
jgi:hypothetical protein